MAQLTEAQAAVYDRQLRVWGLDVQQRLSAAKVLVAGGDGLAAEAHFGNFLIPCGRSEESSVAEASVATLQAMNPLIRVAVQPGSAAGGLSLEDLQQFDTIVVSGLCFSHIEKLEEACRSLGKQLFACLLRGSNSCTFVNLNTHTFSEKAAGGQKGAPSQLVYPALQQALSTPLSRLDKRTHPLYPVVRIAYLFEKEHGRPAGPQDVDTLKRMAADLVKSEEAGPRSAPRGDLLEAWACHGAELAPVASVVGGIVANHVIRAVSGSGPPIKNLFFFSLLDNMGVVEDMPA